MEYLTIDSDIRVVIRGFTKKADADKAKFTLYRRDNNKKILDNASAKVVKAATLDPHVWTLTIDDEILAAAITKDEMQCGMYVSITAGGKTWSPPAQEYILYRDKITLSAKNTQNAALANARCTCAIRPPDDYHPKSAVTATSATSLLNPAASSGRWAPDPRTVVTGADGTVILPLDAPGDLDLMWSYPHYPKDQAAWIAQKGEKREVVLLERERKARFLWPLVANGDKQKHYVNLTSLPASNRGRKMKIEVGVDRPVAGDKIYLTVELTSSDTKAADGKTALKCDVGGDLEVGKPKKTITFALEADAGSRAVELDFKGWGGITARLTVSTVEGSSDEAVEVTSWRKVDVQPYHPAAGFFDGDAFPAVIIDKVKAAYDAVFIEMEFLPSRLLAAAFDGVEVPGKFAVVPVSGDHAAAIDLNAGSRTGASALVYFKMGRNVADTPAHWIKRPRTAPGSSGAVYDGVYLSVPQTTLHLVLAHHFYIAVDEAVSLTLSSAKLVSDPQTCTTKLCIRNIDVNENPGGDMILPWSGTTPSYWQVVGEETRGDITMDFLEVDREKAKLGVFEYTVKLPDGAPGDPKGLATSGKTIKLSMKLRSYKFGVAGEGLYPVIYAGLNTDYASSSAAYTVIHELAHALDFAPKTGEFHYSMAGAHCCYGIKSDVEAYVRDNGGTLGATINATINIKPNGKNIPVELVTQGKFGKCVMWGQTHRQKTTEALFAAAIKFCGTCAPLMRVTPIGAKCGGEV